MNRFRSSIVQLNNARNKRIVVALTSVVLVLVALALATPVVRVAAATDTPTPTLTPTNTATPTNTPVATGFPSFQGGGLVQSLKCGAFQGGATPVPGDCIGIYQGGSLHIYDDNGKLVFSVDGKTGNVTEVGSVSSGTLGLKCIRGEQNVIGAATVAAATPSAAGISTPVYVIASMNADAAGDHAQVTTTNATGIVTLKVWNSALTPVAATTVVAVDYQVCGN